MVRPNIGGGVLSVELVRPHCPKVHIACLGLDRVGDYFVPWRSVASLTEIADQKRR